MKHFSLVAAILTGPFSRPLGKLPPRTRLALAAALALAGPAQATQWNFTGSDAGSWSAAANWTLNGGSTHQVPGVGDDAVLGLAPSVSTVNYNATYGGLGLNSLTLNAPGHPSITLLQKVASTMVAASEYIGTTAGFALYDQSAGSNTTNALYLGFSNGGVGVYSLTGTGVLNATSAYVGYNSGGGQFNQGGGTFNVSSRLVLGDTSNYANNDYQLSAGTLALAAGALLSVGQSYKATFTQYGGSTTFAGGSSALVVGMGGSSSGSVVTLAGTGSMSGMGRISVGLSGSGTFSQAGGTLNLASNGTLAIGDGVNGTGVFNLSGTSSLGTSTLNIGNAGTGTLNQSGGSLVVGGPGVTSVGTSAGATGQFNLSGGTALTNTLNVGDGGSGTLTQSGGTLTAGAVLTVGRLAGSVGTVNLSAGNLIAGSGGNVPNVFIGGAGTGTVNQTGGSFTALNGANSSVSLGAAGGSGTYNLSGGSLGTAYLQLGNGGSGAFIQSAGTVGAVQLNISTAAASSGSYALSGGAASTLNVSSFEAIGQVGAGSFTQTGGTHNLGGDLQLGVLAGATGSYVLGGGAFNVQGNIGVGQSGAGSFQQSGGALVVNGGVSVGSGAGSTGTFAVSGGSATVGALYLGNQAPGTLTQSGGTLNVGTAFVGTQFASSGPTGTLNHTAGALTVGSALYLGTGLAAGSYALGGTGVLNAPNSPDNFKAAYIGGKGSFTQSGGTVNGHVVNAGSFAFHGGVFNGTLDNSAEGTATFDSFVFFGAGLKNHGALNVVSGGQVGTNQEQTFSNDGTVTLSGTGQIFSNGLIVNNGLIRGTGSIGGNSIGAGASFINNLSIVQDGGPLTFSFAAGFAVNNGTITLASGRAMNLFGGLTNAGAIELNGASVLQNGVLSNAVGGTLSGGGSIVSGFSNSGTVAPGASTLRIGNAWTNSGTVQLSGSLSSITGGLITNVSTLQGVGSVGAGINNSGTIEALGGGTLTLAGNLTNGPGGTLLASTGNKLLVQSGLAANAGVIHIGGGTFDNNSHALGNTGQIALGTGGSFVSAGLTNAAGGQIDVLGATLRVNGAASNDAASVINLHGGSAFFSGGLSNSGQLNVSFSGAQVFGAVNTTGSGRIILSGNSNSTFYGSVDVASAGELRVSAGSTAVFFGAVFQRTGAQFTGTGSKFYEGGFSFGNSPGLGLDSGDVGFTSTNAYLAEIGGLTAGTQFDAYRVAGALTFGGTLKLASYSGFVAQAGQTFDLFDWGSSAGTFGAIDASGFSLAAGTLLDTSRLYIDGTVSVQAVPEPGAWALVLLGLGGLGAVLRRRASKHCRSSQRAGPR